MSLQISALLQKNFNQLKNHKCNTFCNIINPIIWLFVIFFARQLAEIIVIQSLPVLKTDVPVIYNIPLYSKLKYSNLSAKTTNCEEWYLYDFSEKANNETKAFFQNLISPKNMISSYCDDNPPQFNFSPYFRTPLEARHYPNEKSINEYLYNRGVELNHISIQILNEEKILTMIPDGAMTINIINSTYFDYQVQIRDYMVSDYHRGSGVTLFYILNDNTKGYEIFPSAITGIMWEIGIMNKAYIHEIFPNITVVSGLQILPISPEDNEVNVIKIVGIVTSGLYPISISLLIPFFMHSIVKDKEKKIIQLLKINGVKMRYYWISNFIIHYIIYLIMAILYIVFEIFIFQLNLLGKTSFLLIILTFLGWGIGQIGLSYFFQAFISKERTSTVISLSIIFFISFFTFCFNMALYVIPREAPKILNIFPTFALYRIFHYITFSCGFHSCISNFGQVNTEIRWSLFFLYLGGIIFIILGILLDDFFQKRDNKNKLFYIDNRDEKILLNDKKSIKKSISNIEEENLDNDIDNDNNLRTFLLREKENENIMNNLSIEYPLNDEELKNEKENIKNVIKSGEEELKQFPFICNELSDGNQKYLNDFFLSIKKNEIFGILDSMGAGKASFYSLLNFIFNLKTENIYINGYNIKLNIDKIYELICFCPNFNILWDDLTVKDTLVFYSKIKNRKKGKIKIFQMVKTILSKTKLESKKNKLVGKLKEKMKRRLSLGIALIGEPDILFIDEPSIGLNPFNKRKIWNILNNFKEQTSMIISSHFMDEIQIFCDRIGIVEEGKIKYIGNQYKFISEYSKKFKLEIGLNQNKDKKQKDNNKEIDIIEKKEDINTLNKDEEISNKEKIEKIKYFIYEIFPKGCSVFEKNHYNISFKIRYDVLNINTLHKKLQEMKEKLYISNWGISQFNLENTFIKMIKIE